MADTTLRLQVILNAIDKLSRPLKGAQAGSTSLAAALKKSRDALKQLDRMSGQLEGFRRLQADNQKLGERLNYARQRASLLNSTLSASGPPTQRQIVALGRQQLAVQRLEERQRKLQQQTARVRAELYRAGISAQDGAGAAARLARETMHYNRQLAQQERQLQRVAQRQNKLNAARTRAAQARDLRNRLAGTGAGVMATGVATGTSLLAPVRAYSASETAANQLAGALMGPDGKVAPAFEQINRLALALGDRLPGTTADFQNMMTMLRRQGMSAEVILGGLGEAAAYLAVQLQMAPTAAAEFAAKLQDATRTSEQEMMSLLDLIQKGFYAGVDPNNMLQGFAQISSAMDIVHKQGVEAATLFAPLLVMADQASMAGEAAGNAYRKVFQAVMDARRVEATNSELRSRGIHLDFSNGKGEFGGIEQMYAQLAKLQKLNTSTRLSVIKTLFGNDAETRRVLLLMINQGLAGYQAAAAKLETQASLRQRVDASLHTLANLWDAASGTFTNALASIGETVAPQLKALVDKLGTLASRFDELVKRHPRLVAALFKLIAGFSAVMIAIGTLSLALASILGPFIVIRFALTMLGIQILPMVTSAIQMAGRALLWLTRTPLSLLRTVLVALPAAFGALVSPIGIVVAALLAAAVVIWKYWRPIKAFLGGLIEGFMTLAEPIKNVLAPLQAQFGRLAELLSRLGRGFRALLVPVDATSETLARAADYGHRFGEKLAQGLRLALDPLRTLRRGVNWLLEKLGLINQEAAKARLPEAPTQTRPASGIDIIARRRSFPMPAYAGLYDQGGIIPSRQFGIVGERGPELISGPAQIMSRSRTAALAALVSSLVGSQVSVDTPRPLHPFSLPASHYSMQPPEPRASSPTMGPTIHIETHAPITIYTPPGQSAQAIAHEVARQLAAREKYAEARARSDYRDQGGYDT
ncbi:phage tail tape measure protein [Edwardsiella tarda]|uniref:phage tail tape measure protein n=1 Tax=Edwardsiella tarda TaxID=636 RepID=UPI00098FF3BD|nr:phage tail tape measure protein [Edwardsiella tarda]